MSAFCCILQSLNLTLYNFLRSRVLWSACYACIQDLFVSDILLASKLKVLSYSPLSLRYRGVIN